MKKVTFLVLLFFSYNCFGQKVTKRDTVYFLVDIAKIPPNDNIISTLIEGPAKWFVFNCECLKYNGTPSFYSIISKRIIIDKKEFKKLKLISITQLMKIVKANDNYNIDDKCATWFIEPKGRKYILQRAFYEPTREPTYDTEVISVPDRSQNKKPWLYKIIPILYALVFYNEGIFCF